MNMMMNTMLTSKNNSENKSGELTDKHRFYKAVNEKSVSNSTVDTSGLMEHNTLLPRHPMYNVTASTTLLS